MGDRWSNPLDQWPDPEVYIHYPSRQHLAYMDIRNLNRAWPGPARRHADREDCYAFIQMIKQEKVDIVIDLHEAELQYPVISTIVAHQKGQDLAAMASMVLSGEEFKIGVEYSPKALHGLSHREIGDHTDAISLLFESPEPFLDATRGRTDAKLLLEGKDEFVVRAGKRGLLFEKIDEKGWPIDVRVGRHCSTILSVLDLWTHGPRRPGSRPEKRPEIRRSDRTRPRRLSPRPLQGGPEIGLLRIKTRLESFLRSSRKGRFPGDPMRTYESISLGIPEILLPKSGLDLTKWAVIACDQYTSEPAYWAKAAALVGDAPSTLNLIYPEVFLNEPETDKSARIARIRETMAPLHRPESLRESGEGIVYVERTTGGRTRKGLVVALDLEQYDFRKGSSTLIRATEGTILERIPPRVKIREGAPIELPHIMVLIDDPAEQGHRTASRPTPGSSETL